MISIGNLASGGSGKTPFCIYLAGLLRDSGLRVAISHRGYKGSLERFAAVVSDGERILTTVSESGDEADLLARRLTGVPVAVGKERCAAVSLLLASFPDTQLVLLDDAFQHLKIARDLDIVCFDSKIGLGNGRVLPAGYLREPLSALPPRSLLAVINKDVSPDPTAINGLLAATGLPVIKLGQQVTGLVDTRGEVSDPSLLAGKRVLLVSGIAHPDSFSRTVRTLDVTVLQHLSYPDHHAFSDVSEAEKLAGLCQKYQAEYLLCTEKDLTKLSRHPWLSDLLLAVRVELDCPQRERMKELVWERLGL